VVDIGVPRLNPDGSFAGYIGSCIDVTESKLAEEALASMGRKLIEEPRRGAHLDRARAPRRHKSANRVVDRPVETMGPTFAQLRG
jgi:hypothetical protein